MRRALFGFALLAATVFAPALGAEEPQAKHGEHVPSFDSINWVYGIFGEREGVEPSIAFRPKGMPAPFGMWIIDAALLYGFLIKKTKKPLREALKNRKDTILRGMEEAARMKRDAEKRLHEYEQRLAKIEEEVERVRSEMRSGAEIERVRILDEARARRMRMERDATLLVEQELAAARDSVKGEMVAAAMSSAGESVRSHLKPEDQQRFADEYLAGLGRSGSTLAGRVRA